MVFLAVDVGNSNTKIGLFDGLKLIKSATIPTQKNKTHHALINAYRSAFNDISLDINIFVSSVVSDISNTLKAHARLINHHAPLDFTIDRVDPATLGADLIAGAQAVASQKQTPAIIIDAGTATTLTYLSDQYVFKGGLITPGISTCASALFKNASLLKPITLAGPLDPIAKTTDTAIRSGLVLGHAMMIKGLVDMMIEDQGLDKPHVICTGGSMRYFSKHLPISYEHDPHLVLKGIASIAVKDRPRAVMI